MKDKFLEELRNKLIDLNDKDVDDTIAYFNEMIEDKVSENARDKFVHYYGFNEYITKLLTQEKVIETLFPLSTCFNGGVLNVTFPSFLSTLNPTSSSIVTPSTTATTDALSKSCASR